MQTLIYGILGGLAIGVGLGWLLRSLTGRQSGSAQAGPRSGHAAEVAAMTAGLAHEIKNPLSTIGMNAQLLDEAIVELAAESGGDEQETVRIRRRIGTLVRETERLRGILTDFLEFAGELRLHPTRGDLNAVVEELCDFFLPAAEKAGVRLRFEPTPGPVEISADIPHLKQALLNLMLNATQAIEGAGGAGGAGRAGGELILRVSESRRGGRREATVHVIDTGPGMDEEQSARVFEPYFSTKRGGTGLGLPTTKRIIEAHGGRLDLITEAGRGTDFSVTLPMAEAAPGSSGR